MSDYLDICLQTNTTPNDDVQFNVLGSSFDKVEAAYVQTMLLNDYGITLETSEISELMEEYGIDNLSTPIEVSLHDILFDALQEDT